ncbi:hypothetical protein LTS18_003261, partial [Coniosporium uncinatum]
MASRVPRSLIPRTCANTIPQTHRFQCLARRHASTAKPSSSKPIVLEKPDKFRPPSHAARLPKRKQPRSYPGPPLSKQEIDAQKTKQYPHMMPPEGSFMHWFLTNRTIHLWLTL